MPAFDDRAIRRYLLGLLTEEEAQALEEAYLASPETLERVRGIEDDLLEEYAAGLLGPEEKEALVRRYLASDLLRARVLAAQALRLAKERAAAAARADAVGPMRWNVFLAAAAMLVLVLVAYTVWRSPAPDPNPPIRVAATAGSRFVLAFTPLPQRAEQEPIELRIPPGTGTIVLELEGDPEAAAPVGPNPWPAVLATVEGAPVWSGDALRLSDARRPALLAFITIPAERLPPGGYLLSLGTGDGTHYRYSFRVAAR